MQADAPSSAIHSVHQSVVRWPYQPILLDEFCQDIAEIGFEGVDVLPPEEFGVPQRYGLRCTMGLAGLGDNKAIGLNRVENHGGFESALRKSAPLAEKAGVIWAGAQVFICVVACKL